MIPIPPRYGPWAVITGAASGIGPDVAERLAANGLDLVLVAPPEAEARALADGLTSRHGVATRVLPLDVARPDAADALHAATADLDVGLAVLNASLVHGGPFLEGDPARDAEMLALNCGAVAATSRVFGRRFVARKGGALVLAGSILAFAAAPRAAVYAATKAFVQSLAESLDAELGPHGVDVLALAPGPHVAGVDDPAGVLRGGAMSPAEVADAAVRALGRRGTVFPGWLPKR
jgi:short-subunit dehydrogenase